MKEQKDWIEEKENDQDQEEDFVSEYDITASPNDFNVKTIFDFIESSAVVIPDFQRNYVWDIKRASRLVESIILNIPIPQIFLYEETRNKFQVIDGQQRLMTIYYFVKGRFPIFEKRTELRRVFDERGIIPNDYLLDPKYFEDFNLKLQDEAGEINNKLHGLNYKTLKEHKTSFDLRAIRNVIIKKTTSKDEEDDAIYEIFKRLNTGGINLTPQEIRESIYHSDFYKMLHRVNLNEKWRKIIGLADPDLHLKDIEILLRSIALLANSANYSSSMARFLNKYSKDSKQATKKQVEYLEKLFVSFIESCSQLKERAFFGEGGKFSISIFEAVFYATCKACFKKNAQVAEKIDPKRLEKLKKDKGFKGASQARLSNKKNVIIRLNRAEKIL